MAGNARRAVHGGVRMRRIPAPAAVLIMAAAIMAALGVWTLAHADDDASPPECPPPEPYPAPYPAPGSYLPLVVEMEAYP